MYTFSRPQEIFRSLFTMIASEKTRLSLLIQLLCTTLGCLAQNTATDSAEETSVFGVASGLAPVARRERLPHGALPRELTPDERSLMLAFEELGFPPISTCTWANFDQRPPGWLCLNGVLHMPLMPIYGSDEDLPRWDDSFTQEAAPDPNGFELAIHRLRTPHHQPASVQQRKRELEWLTKPRDSRHLTWTAFAHWALERGRMDLFRLCMDEVAEASEGRCPATVRYPLAAAMLASAAASISAASKVRISRGEWSKARDEASHALALLTDDALRCRHGSHVARDSARAVLRRAEIELAVGASEPTDAGTMTSRVDSWLLQLMRSDCDSPEKSAAYQSLRQLKENVVPHLLLHMDEPALCAPSNGANPSFRGEAFYYVPGRDWYGPPTTLGDVVVTIIEDIAGQEFTSPGRSKSTDIGAHLAIYAWWAGRQKALEEEAAAQEPKSPWQRVRKKLGFE